MYLDTRKQKPTQLTFDQFKTLLLPLFVNSHYFDNDKLREVYLDYDELRHAPAFDTVKKFAAYYFKDWKKGTHETWLKSHKEQRQGNAPKPKTVKIRPVAPKTQNIKSKEAKAMREFWDENADWKGCCKCMETGQLLRAYDPYYVHHVYTKGAHCLSRLDKENFVIVSYDVHNVIHTEGETRLKLYPHFLEVRKKMKIRYNKLKSVTQ